MHKIFHSPKISISSSKKSLESYCIRSPAAVYQKLFLNHIQKEVNPDWFYQNGRNEIVNHPSMSYTVSLLGQFELDFSKNLYAIALLPVNYWLVRERGRIVELRHASLGSAIREFVAGAATSPSLNHTSLNGNFIAEMLTSMRPTGYIVDTVNCLKPLIVAGETRQVGNEHVFVPSHRGFPVIRITEGLDAVSSALGSRKSTPRRPMACQIVQWDYLEPPLGRLLPQMPFNHDPLAIFSHGARRTAANSTSDSSDTSTPDRSLETATARVLDAFTSVKDAPFSADVLACVPQTADAFAITAAQRKARTDLTDKCVVSIDPADAKDLDDALHVERIDGGAAETETGGNYRVGVHIADVSHFVKSSTALDREAHSRASSVYLRHKVIPMLPPILSEHLCSLNPDEDKLTFSVIFVLDGDGKVLSHEFVKSIIRPKMRLSYEQANTLIDGHDLPELASKSDYERARESLRLLNELAMKMRKRRIASGAVALDKIEIQFSLEAQDALDQEQRIPEPTGFRVKTRGKSSFLIEEFMLLANQASANVLFNHLLANRQSKLHIGALLRMHSPPTKTKWHIFNNCCKDAGIRIPAPEDGKLQETMNALKLAHPSKALALDYLTYFSMESALYCCAENHVAMSDPNKHIAVSNDVEFPFYHFGLNVPLYTHFTSPIRRYADVLVHRQLEAIMKSKKACGVHIAQRLEAAHNSNVARLANRRVGDLLTSTFMAAYLDKQGWRLTRAIILIKAQNYVKLLLPSLGIISLVEMRHFAPWALECSELVAHVSDDSGRRRLPKQIQLKYLTDINLYSVNIDNGFSQYEYDWDKDVDEASPSMDGDRDIESDIDECDEEAPLVLTSLDETIDGFRLGTRMNDAANQRIRNAASAVLTVSVFDEVDCLVYCSRDELRLCVELPFPPSLCQLKEEASVLI